MPRPAEPASLQVAPSNNVQADRLRKLLDEFQLELDKFLKGFTGSDGLRPPTVPSMETELVFNDNECVLAGDAYEACRLRSKSLEKDSAAHHGTRIQSAVSVRHEDDYNEIRSLKLSFERTLKLTPSLSGGNRSTVITADDLFVLRARYKGPAKVCGHTSRGMLSKGAGIEKFDLMGAHTKEECIQKYKLAIKVLNDPSFGCDNPRRAFGRGLVSPKDESSESRDDIDLESYVNLMLVGEENLRAYDCGDKDVSLALMDIHHLFFVTNTSNHLDSIFHFSSEQSSVSISAESIKVQTNRLYFCINWVAGMLVLINSLTMGLSLDYSSGWIGWSIFEWVVTGFFLIEIILRLYVVGPCNFFFEADVVWNLFDTLVVVMATVDMIGTIAFATDLQGNVSVLRVVRFMRLTRFVRVIRISLFKELRLLLSGLFGGYRTLCWALLFLTYLVYFMGVIIRDTMARADEHACDAAPWGSVACARSLAIFLRNREELVGSLPRSMFTSFRCLMSAGECASLDGSPLALMMWEIYGWPTVLCYVIILVFVIFGVFNLIMAVVVESTIEHAKHHEHARLQEQMAAHAEEARLLEQLVMRCCLGAPVATPKRESVFKRFVALFSFETQSSLTLEPPGGEPLIEGTVKTKLRHDEFMRLLDDPIIQKTLDELDIAHNLRGDLFDILDANGDGFLDVKELVDGMIKLRGCRSADVVALSLICRSVQESIKSLQALILEDRCETQIQSHKGEGV